MSCAFERSALAPRRRARRLRLRSFLLLLLCCAAVHAVQHIHEVCPRGCNGTNILVANDLTVTAVSSNDLPPLPLSANAVRKAFGPTATGHLNGTIVIAGPLSLTATDPYYSYSMMFARSCEIFARWMNEERGGISLGGGRWGVQFVFVDERSSKQQTAAATAHAIRTSGADVAISGYSSGLTKYSAQQSFADGLVMVSAGAATTSVFQQNAYTFGFNVPTGRFMKNGFGAISYAAQRLDQSQSKTRCGSNGSPNSCFASLSFGFVQADTLFTRAACAESSLKSAMSAANLPVPSTLRYATISATPTESEVDAALAGFRSAGVNVVFGCTYIQTAEAIVDSLERLDWTPYAVFTTESVSNTATWTSRISNGWWQGEFVMGPAPWHRSLVTQGAFSGMTSVEFVRRFSSYFDGVIPSYQAAANFAACIAVADAIERADSLDSAAIAAKLESVDLDEFFGRIRIDSNHQIDMDMVVLQIGENMGDEQIIYPREHVLEANEAFLSDGGFPMPTWTQRRCGAVGPTLATNYSAGRIIGTGGSTGASSRLASVCSGNGLCNATGHCECNAGWSGSSCEARGIPNALCPPGTEPRLDGAGAGCAPCMIGTYKETAANIPCTGCPQDATTFGLGSTGKGSCICRDGYYRANNATPPEDCERCPALAICESNALMATLQLRPGAWRVSNETTDIHVCANANIAQHLTSSRSSSSSVWLPNATTSQDAYNASTYDNSSACVGGPEALELGTGYCRPGHQGPRCTACVNEYEGGELNTYYFDAETSTCKPCQDTGNRLSLIVGIGFVGLAGLGLAYREAMRRAERNPNLKARIRAVRTTIVAMGVLAKLKIIIAFLQIWVNVPSFYDVNLPPNIRQWFEWLSFISLNLTFLIPDAQCLGSLAERLTILSVAPLILVGAVYVCSLGLAVTEKARSLNLRRSSMKPVSRRPSSSWLSAKSLPRLSFRHSPSSTPPLSPPPSPPQHHAAATTTTVTPPVITTVTTTVASTDRDQSLCFNALIMAAPLALFVLFCATPAVSLNVLETWLCEEFVSKDAYEEESRRVRWDETAEKTVMADSIIVTHPPHMISFLKLDANIVCGTREHQGIVNVAYAYLLVWPVGMPLLFALLLTLARKAIMHGRPTQLSQAIMILHSEYRTQLFYWEFVEMVRRLLLNGMLVFMEQGTMRLIAASFLSVVFLCVQLTVKPYKRDGDNILASCASLGLCVMFVSALLVRIFNQTVRGLLDDPSMDDIQREREMEAIMGFKTTEALGYMLVGVCLLMLALITFLITQNSLQARRRVVAARREDEANARLRGRMANPPFARWKVSSGMRYCCFLSHYKVEAGSDARYLRDLIQSMCASEAYLDSQNLVDLTELFHEGLHKSEVMVVLATKEYLTRPWCLLELWECHRTKVPLLLMPVSGRGFDRETARSQIQRVDQDLPLAGLRNVLDHLKTQNVTDLNVFKRALLQVMGLSEDDQTSTLRVDGGYTTTNTEGTISGGHQSGGPPSPPQLVWEPWANDHQILASSQRLLDMMATLTGRSLEWEEKLESSFSSQDSRRQLNAATPKSRSLASKLRLRASARRANSTAPELLLIFDRFSNSAASTARMLQNELKAKLGTWAISLSSATEASLSLEMGRVDIVVLLQTAGIYQSAHVLTQLFEALTAEKPIAPVRAADGGYDYGAAAKALSSPETVLSSSELTSLEDMLTKRAVTLARLGTVLGDTIPYKISQTFNPVASDGEMAAFVSHFCDLLPRVRGQCTAESQRTQRRHLLQKHQQSVLKMSKYLNAMHSSSGSACAHPPNLARTRAAAATGAAVDAKNIFHKSCEEIVKDERGLTFVQASSIRRASSDDACHIRPETVEVLAPSVQDAEVSERSDFGNAILPSAEVPPADQSTPSNSTKSPPANARISALARAATGREMRV